MLSKRISHFIMTKQPEIYNKCKISYEFLKLISFLYFQLPFHLHQMIRLILKSGSLYLHHQTNNFQNLNQNKTYHFFELISKLLFCWFPSLSHLKISESDTSCQTSLEWFIFLFCKSHVFTIKTLHTQYKMLKIKEQKRNQNTNQSS